MFNDYSDLEDYSVKRIKSYQRAPPRKTQVSLAGAISSGGDYTIR